ncbi:MAG: serine/threonine protein kinase, partial [Planctomycetaceae bacterium]|nr:serine/threonine protein kinase [Planctomycetaceae bacterium]
PSISEFLSRDTTVPSETLLVELIQIDLHYRRQQGETPNPRDYLDQFPDYSPAILRLSGDDRSTVEFDSSPPHAHPQVRAARFGRYELEEILGQGGFGVVWRAIDSELQRRVAIKIAHVSDSVDMQRLFHREAKAMATLSHPHVVRVIDYGIESEFAYIVSELIDGRSLSSAIQVEDFDLPRSTECVKQVASGLEHVHARGIVHRDLKPGNILLKSNDQPVIVDFGLARHGDPESTIAQPGQVMGTYPYMSPEQVLGEPVDHTTDLYSLGVILYRLIAGRCPFDGSPREIQQKILHAVPADPRQFNPQASESLARVCLKAMARERSERYQSAEALRTHLESLLAGQTVALPAPAIKPTPNAPKPGSRRSLLLAAASVGGLGTAGYLSRWIWPEASNSGGSPVTVPVDGARSPSTVPIRLTTTPPGAQVVMHPVNYDTGRVEPERRIVFEQPSPIDADVPPGDYLVVAHLEDGRFHEVYRHVPAPDESGVQGLLSHQRFLRTPDGHVELPNVELSNVDPSSGMVTISGQVPFVLLPYYPPDRLKKYAVPAFFVDAHEFTQGEIWDLNATESKRDRYLTDGREFPLVIDNRFDQFMNIAERLGKRLLTDLEFVFVTTNGGQTRYPWGDEMHLRAAAVGPVLTPVGEPDWDRTRHTPPVQGLCSGVAEWVDAQQASPFGDHPAKILPIYRNHLIIMGGGERVLLGDFRVDDEQRNPRKMLTRDRTTPLPGVGCRFARSARPRLDPEDFLRELPG